MKSQPIKFKEKIQELLKSDYIKKTSRLWWPKYFFHYTDVNNAARILIDGKLYSRNKLEENFIMPVDNASPNIILNTQTQVKDFVRLYFRPKTPTQFSNEGIRPNVDKIYGSHCPLPVFFLFDSYNLIIDDNCYFTERTLAGKLYEDFNEKLKYTYEHFQGLDFKKIYHIGRYDLLKERDIKSYRMAEIIFPNELDLSHLKFIVCRSGAEKDTLVNLISDSGNSEWIKKVTDKKDSDLFELKWSFVEKVITTENFILFNFSPDSKASGPFNLVCRVQDMISAQILEYTKSNFYAVDPLKIELIRQIKKYKVKLLLDDALACYCSFER